MGQTKEQSVALLLVTDNLAEQFAQATKPTQGKQAYKASRARFEALCRMGLAQQHNASVGTAFSTYNGLGMAVVLFCDALQAKITSGTYNTREQALKDAEQQCIRQLKARLGKPA
jgi:hypothetical protein